MVLSHEGNMVVSVGVLRDSKMYLLMLGENAVMVGMERGALHFIARSPNTRW